MIKEFKTDPSAYKNNIYLALCFLAISILFFMFLGVFPGVIFPIIILWLVMAFWGKDRVLITMHEDYLEAKEAIVAKKKLIRYKNIDRLEEHKTGKLLIIHLKNNAKKEAVNLTSISKPDKEEFIKLMSSKISNANT